MVSRAQLGALRARAVSGRHLLEDRRLTLTIASSIVPVPLPPSFLTNQCLQLTTVLRLDYRRSLMFSHVHA